MAEKFVNELDRHLSPYLSAVFSEKLGGSGNKPQRPRDEGLDLNVRKQGFRCPEEKLDFSLIEGAGGYLHFQVVDLDVELGAPPLTLAYERVLPPVLAYKERHWHEGWTTELHAGSWVHRMLDVAMPLFAQVERLKVLEVLVTETTKASRFTPVWGIRQTIEAKLGRLVDERADVVNLEDLEAKMTGFVKPGNRNTCFREYAQGLKNNNRSPERTLSALRWWNARLPKPLGDLELSNIVHEVYQLQARPSLLPHAAGCQFVGVAKHTDGVSEILWQCAPECEAKNVSLQYVPARG